MTEKDFKIRINIFIVIVILSGILLILQLFNLQILNGDYYEQQSQKTLIKYTSLKAPRGNILDRNGKILVTNKESFNVVISSEQEGTLKQYIQDLREILQKNGDESKFVYNDNANSYYYDDIVIAKDISKESALEIEERKNQFEGIHIQNDWARHYVYGNMACHLIGYVGSLNETEYSVLKDKGYSYNDIIGKDGIEKMFEEYLKGKDGKKQIRLEYQDGSHVIENNDVNFVTGNDVYLTIDFDLQLAVEKALKENIEKISTGFYGEKFENATKGAVVIRDIKTGEILAMASYPTYEASDFANGLTSEKWNLYKDEEQKPLYNRAISGLYAPGSTFKMITAIGGLNEGIITLDEKIEDMGMYTGISGVSPRCLIYSQKNGYGTHGSIDVTDAIKVSCNYFFYYLGHKLGIDMLSKYATFFELGNKTGIELFGENKGIVASREYRKRLGREWYIGEVLSASIGQSDNAFTPIQMANYISIIGNYGIKTRTHLISKIVKGTEVINSEDVIKSVEDKVGKYEMNSIDTLKIPKEYYDVILNSMKKVTKDVSGTAYYLFGQNDMNVIGKTGTAEGVNKDDDGWFVGIVNDTMAISVIIEEAGHGSWVATVVRDIIENYK